MDWQREWAIALGSQGRSLWRNLRLLWGRLPEPWRDFLVKVALFFWRNGGAWWLIVAVGEALAALAVFAWGYDSLPSDPITNRLDRTTYYYLLSAQAQALAAVLALVFTLSLVAAQLAQRYTSRLFTQVFGLWALVYLIPFIVAVIYPFLLLNRGFVLAEAQASLLLGAYCTLSLIAYFSDLRNGLRLETLIQRQKEEAIDCYKKWSRGKDHAIEEPQQIATLDNMAMGAFDALDFDTFGLAVAAVADVTMSVTNNALAPQTTTRQLLRALIKRLKNMGLRTIADPSAPLVILSALQKVGVKAAEQKNGSSCITSIFALGEIGEKAAQQRNEDVSEQAAQFITQVGMSFYAQLKTDEDVSVIWALDKLADRVAEKQLESSAKAVADSLIFLGATALEHSLTSVCKRIGEALLSLEKRWDEYRPPSSSKGKELIDSMRLGLILEMRPELTTLKGKVSNFQDWYM